MTNPSITIPSPTTIGASGSDAIDASGSNAVGAVPGSVICCRATSMKPAYFAASHEDSPAIPIEENLSTRLSESANASLPRALS